MAAGTRQSNTMEEILRKQLAMFADLKLADDADFDWIAQQEAGIIEKLRGPADKARALMEAQASTAASPQMGGPVGMTAGTQPQMPPGQDPTAQMILQAIQAQGGGMGGPPPGAPPGTVPGAMPPGRGPTMSPAMPSPDELRRVMSQGQGM